MNQTDVYDESLPAKTSKPSRLSWQDYPGVVTQVGNNTPVKNPFLGDVMVTASSFVLQPPDNNKKLNPESYLQIMKKTETLLTVETKMAGGLGFEPRLIDPESTVLPLDDPPAAKTAKYINTIKLVVKFLSYTHRPSPMDFWGMD